MFEKRHIAARHTHRLTAVADSADTTIHVNTGGGNPPPRPEFHASPRVSQITRPEDSARYSTTAPTISTHTARTVNWGSVVKGAAMVAGVVLVGVVAYYAVPALLTSLGVIGPGGVLTGLVEAATPAVNTLGGYAMNALNFADDFVAQSFLNLTNALGLGGAVSSVTGAVSSASAATASVVHSVTAGVAATATMAAGIPLALKSMVAMPFTETVQHIDTTSTTGLADGGASVVQHKKAGLAAQSAMAFDAPDEHLLHDQATSMKAASKVAHHAAETGSQEGSDANIEPDAPEHRHTTDRARSALRNTEHANKAWADRVGPREKHAITARNSEFASQIAEDRAKLDAALAERG